MRTRVAPARLALRTEDGSYQFLPLMIEIPDARGYAKGLPSVMGQDVISRLRLELDRTSDTVVLRDPDALDAVRGWMFEDQEEFGEDFDGLNYREALDAVQNPANYPGLRR